MIPPDNGLLGHICDRALHDGSRSDKSAPYLGVVSRDLSERSRSVTESGPKDITTPRYFTLLSDGHFVVS